MHSLLWFKLLGSPDVEFSITGHIGRQAIRSGNHLLDLLAFGYRIASGLLKKTPEDPQGVRRCILEEVYFSCIGALTIIIPAALLIGSTMMVYLSRVSEQLFMGKAVLILIVREIGPAATTLLLILRSATAMTGEILCMRVLAVKGCPKDWDPGHVKTVCIPRVLGMIISILLLFIVFDVSAIFGGFGVVWALTDLPLGNLLDQVGKALTFTDILVVIIKAMGFGTIIGVTSLFHGFNRQPEIFSIPHAASRAAVESFFYCLVANVAVSTAFYL
ncbi:MAG: hypothetical protein COS92_08180 [Desulfobacterales bacterium CG07_land_8_20_14_0_80_52_14]|nr:MAG: hypothetical protein COS92_08180 [Desulfobacterales bacterium CG07_land_8_20_14_0_80_52_14]